MLIKFLNTDTLKSNMTKAIKHKKGMRSKHYQLMKMATVFMFVLVIAVGTIVMYGLIKYYGFDISNQITAAAVTNLTAP